MISSRTVDKIGGQGDTFAPAINKAWNLGGGMGREKERARLYVCSGNQEGIEDV